MKKLLIYSHILPYPLNNGGASAQYYILEELAKVSKITFVSIRNSQSEIAIKALQGLIPNVDFKLLDYSQQFTVKTRFKQIISVIETYLGLSKKSIGGKKKYFNIMGIIDPMLKYSNDFMINFQKIVLDVVPDCIQIDFIENANIAFFIPKDIPAVLIVHEVRFNTVSQYLKSQNHSLSIYENYLVKKYKKKELEAYKQFSHLICFNNNEVEIIKKKVSKPNISIIPFGVNIKNNHLNISNFISIKNLVFLGPGHHLPNKDALMWYAREMHEDIYNNLGLTLKVIGKWEYNEMALFSDYRGIEFIGYVNDLSYHTRNAIMIVPLRIGSGIRTKILDAFNECVPVITTTQGCCGLDLIHKREVFIANTLLEFKEGIKYLKSGDNSKKQILRALDYLTKHHSPIFIAMKREILYNRLVQKLSS